MSRKHQITLPADMVRDLGLKAGQKYVIASERGQIVLYPDKHTTTAYFAGSLEGTYGRTKEEIDAYLHEIRAGWERELPWPTSEKK
ncbi:MAG: AbrB/MazE/SpoVT family DNA-binding domain-containing protein [Dehalococcoidia bacterium]